MRVLVPRQLVDRAQRTAGVDPVSWITDYVEDALSDAQRRLERQAACHVLEAIGTHCREDRGWLEEKAEAGQLRR